MNQSQILQNRTSNILQNLKHKLRQDRHMILYNDLLIIEQVLLTLNLTISKETVRQILYEFKKIQREIMEIQKRQEGDGGNFEDVSLSGVIQILGSITVEGEDRDDQLLNDFLRCSVKVPGEAVVANS